MTQGKKRKVAIVGARGYSGLALARLLLRHPAAELVACFAHDQIFSLADYLPEAAARHVPVLSLRGLEALLPSLDVVFLATPAEAALPLAAQILGHKNSSASVIDLSGAFRFQAGTEAERAAKFQLWYKTGHAQPALAGQASYGLVPFAPPVSGPKTLIANPGCYATSVLMGIVPLLRAKTIQANTLVIDAKSGTTGAGRKASEALLFTEVEGDCLPYKVGEHQHLPEIAEWAEAFGGVKIDPFFATHLLPVRRGILAGIYAQLSPGANAEAVEKAFAEAYRNYPLARITNLGAPAHAASEASLSPALALSLKKVVGTARVHIAHKVVGDKIYLFSLIDNLLKGAASQAVENFNRLHDDPAALGLDGMEGVL